MHRRIVVLRPHEWLGQAVLKRNFSLAAGALEKEIAVKGVRFDEGFHPVRLRGRLAVGAARPKAVGFSYAEGSRLESFCVRTQFDDEEAMARLSHDRAGEVVGVYVDPEVRAFPSPYCGTKAIGDANDVARRLGVPALRRRRLTGRRVRVAIVDTGLDGTHRGANGRGLKIVGGWSPNPGYAPGSTRPPQHGTMCAFDATIAAPDADVLDYALLQSSGATWNAFLSDAIAAYASLMDLADSDPRPLVVNNSWGMYDRSDDEPIGSPGNYSANPDHPFNQIVGSLVAAGADVFFAAGNCGEHCPAGGCGQGDVGPGRSIHGANSHPDVITVAAVTVTHRRLGYSSQGPGGLYNRKPDVAAYSQFVGSGVYPNDNGTSAASPVAAGLAAALRQRAGRSRLAPAQLKGLLQRASQDLGGAGWDYDFGYGVVSAVRALDALGWARPRRRAAASRA
ncbi:MAG: S8 family serine peptidase [Gemmatimonadetes bacterium]|nr:S8 family serine peptidase [Gemmatimonadota bacterium]